MANGNFDKVNNGLFLILFLTFLNLKKSAEKKQLCRDKIYGNVRLSAALNMIAAFGAVSKLSKDALNRLNSGNSGFELKQRS